MRSPSRSTCIRHLTVRRAHGASPPSHFCVMLRLPRTPKILRRILDRRESRPGREIVPTDTAGSVRASTCCCVTQHVRTWACDDAGWMARRTCPDQAAVTFPPAAPQCPHVATWSATPLPHFVLAEAAPRLMTWRPRQCRSQLHEVPARGMYPLPQPLRAGAVGLC